VVETRDGRRVGPVTGVEGSMTGSRLVVEGAAGEVLVPLVAAICTLVDPAMIVEPLAAGVLGRAIERGTLDVKVRDLRDYTIDRHRVVDDTPYGGGPGMVLKPDPIFRALDAVEAERGAPLRVVMMSPQGRRFTQADAQRLSGLPH